MNDHTDKKKKVGDEAMPGSKDEGKKSPEYTQVQFEITLEHAKAAGRAIKAMKKETGMMDVYASMGFMLAYMQASLGIDPPTSMKNLTIAYAAIVANPDTVKQGFKEINDILLEKKIITTH